MPPRRSKKSAKSLIEIDLGDEFLVYDERSHKAHALNASAAAVWRSLDDTAKEDVLARPKSIGRRARGLTRRQVLRGLAAAGAIAPVIATVETAHAGPGIVSARTCTTPGCSPASLCPGTVCCVCVHTTENTNVCATPNCTGAACTSSSQCPPGWVCFTNACCQFNDAAQGAGGGAVGQCVPLCQDPQAPCPAGDRSNTQKRSWMVR